MDLRNNERPSFVWINGETLQFVFEEKISPENVRRLEQLKRFVMVRLGGQVVECVAGYHTLTVFLRGALHVDVTSLLDEWIQQAFQVVQVEKRLLRVPICYDEEFALDMVRMEQETGLDAEEIVRLHSERTYTVFMMGFLPGFPYLGGLDERLVVPRLAVPRTHVKAGSVGVGGAQTGVYPVDSPGGWNIIGRTPLTLFDVGRAKPFLFAPNDEVQFVPIDKREFLALQKDGVSAWSLY